MIKRSKRFKGTIAMLLACSTIVTWGPSTVIANADTSDSNEGTKFTTEADQGVILHAWNWSFNTVKSNLDNIKAAGYTEIQVSPIQINKDINGNSKTSDQWWILYQPAGFTIGNKQLGTEDEFKSMCKSAKEKGIKIIVDTIVNHMGNNGDSNIPADEVDKQLSFKDHPEYWHVDKEGKLHVISDYNNRYDVTHNGVGLPDLNTANKDVQKMAKEFLQRCLDDGAAGFRFDTAKHVELPEEPDDTGDKKISSDFWPSVLEGLKTLEGTKPFIYGEVLQGGSDRIEGYAKYFDVTASNYGGDIRSAVGNGENSESNLSKEFDDIKDYNVPDGIDASQLITWVESHDTYANGSEESTNMTNEQIKNAWAIVASRAKSTPLYFNRTAGRKKLQGNLGDAGDDEWRDPDVVAVNKFHNVMQGQDERLTELNDKIIMIERGTSSDATKKGVVIVNLGDPYELKDQDINLNDNKEGETYNNCAVTGDKFTVKDGKISGTLPKGITVLYEGGKTELELKIPKVSISKENCSFYDSLELTLNVDKNGKTATYSINGVDKGAFTDGQKITIGSEVDAGKSITVVVNATGEDGKTVSETYKYLKKNKDSKAIGYFVKPKDWKAPYAYVSNELGENLGGWPGVKMTKIGENLYKYEIDGFTDGKITFNDWFYGNNKTGDLNISATGMMVYDENGKWKSTEKLAEDPNVEKDKEEKGTSIVYFQKPDNADWKDYDDVCIYFYGSNGGPSWPGVPMQKVEGSTKLYTYTLPAGLEGSNVIFNANGGKVQTPGSGEAGFSAPANSTMIYDGDWREYAKGTSKAYFRKPADWGEPSVYARNGDKKNAEWPGIKMDKVEGTETLYTYTLPEKFGQANIIFTDGKNKTKDLKLPFESSMIYDQKTESLRNFTSDDLKDPDEDNKSDQQKGVTKVYFKNTDKWKNVKVYAFNDGGEVKGWPGVNTFDEGDGLYSYTLPKGFEDAKVIFNNGEGKQTADLKTEIGHSMMYDKETDSLKSMSKVYFKNKEGWEKVKVYCFNDSGEKSKWPGESMVDEGDGLYSYTLPEGFETTNVIFNNNNKGKQTKTIKIEDGETSIFVPSCKGADNKRDGEWREFTQKDIPESGKEDPNKPVNPDEPEKNEETSKVYFKNIEGWGDPYVHYWKTGGESTKWPGIKMQNEGNGIYSYTLPKGYGDANVIFNAQTGKTENDRSQLPKKDGFELSSGSTMIYEDGEWKEFKSDKDEETSQTPKIRGSVYTTTTNIKGTSGADADITLTVDEEIETTTSAGAKVKVISKMEEKEIGSTKADKDGNWSVKIPAQKKGTVIKVTAKEEGKEESSITVTVEKKSSSHSHSSSHSTKTVSVEGNTTKIKSTDESTIKNEISNSTTPNIEIDLSSDQRVDKNIFEALARKQNKTLTLSGDNASWTFKGADILTDKVASIDTTIKSTSPNEEKIKNLTGGKDVFNLSFAHKGILPGKAKIKTSVPFKYNNETMYMYSYSVENNRLALISSNLAVKDSEVTFEITKGSDYILSETPIVGAVKEGWNQNANGNWIFVKDENNVTGWVEDGGNWYLCDQSGAMKTGWAKNNGKWYFLNSSGTMKTGWIQNGSNWYYLQPSGAMKTGWINDNGTWYYLNTDGSMATNTTVSGYELGANGALS